VTTNRVYTPLPLTRAQCDLSNTTIVVFNGHINSKKGKDVDLYSASTCLQDTSNAHFVTETEPPGRIQVTAQTANTALRSDPTTSHRQRQPASIGLHLRNPSLTDYYSFNRPRRDGWLSWPCWLTDTGRFTHNVVTWPAVSLAQIRESSPA